MAILYLVVPCYNEQEVLKETTCQLTEKLNRLIAMGVCHPDSRVLYVDDGSKDATWQVIETLHKENPLVCGIKLAHNRGHQTALLAGLMEAKDRCDCAVSMDADLQDSVEVLDGFMEKFAQGCHVVYGVRSDRKADSMLKRSTAQGYYKFLKALGVEVIYNHADCRLMSRRALEELSRYGESNLFLRGLIPNMGFQSEIVYFQRAARKAGESKYSFRKMLALAWDGVTSFTTKPLQWVWGLGLLVSTLSCLALVACLVLWLCAVPFNGLWAAVASVWLLGGLLMLCMGVLGSYLGKVYFEVKGRPRFAVERTLEHPPTKEKE